MSIEKITSKITGEAEAFRDETLKEAREKCDAVIAEAKEKAQKILEDAEKRGQEEKEKIVLRRKSVSYIDSRKVLLNKKTQLVNECFEGATDYIINMDGERYVDFLVHMGMKSDMYGGLLMFNEEEKRIIGPKVTEGMNRAMFYKRRAKYGDEPLAERYHLSDETGSMKGGFRIKYRMTYADNTVEAFVEEHRMEIAGDVAGILFDEDGK